VRLYRRAADDRGDVAPLCSAAALLRVFGAQLDAVPASEHSADRANVTEQLRTIEPQIVGACGEVLSRTDNALPGVVPPDAAPRLVTMREAVDAELVPDEPATDMESALADVSGSLSACASEAGRR